MQTDLGTESIRSLVTKRSNGFGYTNLGHSRSHKIEKNKTKNRFDPFSYKFFVPIRVGLTPPRTTQKKRTIYVLSTHFQDANEGREVPFRYNQPQPNQAPVRKVTCTSLAGGDPLLLHRTTCTATKNVP